MTSQVGVDGGSSHDAAATARRNSSLVAAGILASRVVGFVRLSVFGAFFGTTAVGDAFTTAFRIPNILQNLLGEGVLSASFIPVHASLVAQGRQQEAGRVAGAVFGLLALIAGGVSLIAIVAADPISALITPGFSADKQALTATLIRIVTPGVGLLVVSAWCLGILNAHRKFFLSYVAPVIWNLAQIAALVGAAWVVLDPPFGVSQASGAQLETLAMALAVGTVVGALLQILVQWPAVRRLEPHLRPSLARSGAVRTIMRAAGPVVAGRGVIQLATWVDLVLASLLATGAVALLGYAQPLYLLPVSVFGMSVAAAELPELSTLRRGDLQALQRRVDDGLARVGFWVVGTAVIYLSVGDLLISVLFQRGAFDSDTVTATWLVLGAFTVGLVATTSSRLLQSVLYGLGDTTTPAKTSVLRVGVSILVGAALMLQLDRVELSSGAMVWPSAGTLPTMSPVDATLRGSGGGTVVRLGAVGLALAASVGAWLEWRLLRQATARQVRVQARIGGRSRGRLVLPVFAALGVGLVVRQVVTVLPTGVAGLLAAGLVGVTYLAVALVTRVEELHGTILTVAPRLGHVGKVLVLWRAQTRRRGRTR